VQLGYNTNGFTSHALADALRVLAGLGYRSVGLTLDHHVLNPLVPDWQKSADQCRALLGELDLLPVVETGARYLLDPWRKHQPTLLSQHLADRRRRIDFLERAVDVARIVGARVVSLWSGSPPVEATPDEVDARLVEGLREVCAYAEAHGITVGFEPEPGMYISSMDEFLWLRQKVDHPALKLTLDVGHAHITEQGGAEETIRRFAQHIVNVHLEGMNRAAHDHLVPWEGDMDVKAVVRTLEAVGYTGPATFELSRHSHVAVETARRALEFVKNAGAAE
jgi:sugar phosphate isomerase/epimerase